MVHLGKRDEVVSGMYEINVREIFDARIEEVFEAVSDHENLIKDKGLICTLVKEGSSDRNGLGAMRRVDAGKTVFQEEIILFSPPHRYDYQIRRLTTLGMDLPFRHESGWLELSEQGEQTTVLWISRFHITIPILGSVMEPIIGRMVTKTFAKLLKDVKKRLVDSGKRDAYT